MRGQRVSARFVWMITTCLLVVLMSTGCNPNHSNTGGSGHLEMQNLASWHETWTKKEIIDFVTSVSDSAHGDYIPQEDRIAVFDMDGTIVCEQPLWLEMKVAVEKMYQDVRQDAKLIENPLYEYAYNYRRNPTDDNRQLLEDNAVAIMTHAFEGYAQEEYVDYVANFINTTLQSHYDILLRESFYRPMLELITYLQEHEFQVYIVSGSEQGLIWGVCAEQVPLPREHEIGTRMELTYAYDPSDPVNQFMRGDEYLDPRNLGAGKAENIYYQLGKIPVFAFGNTQDDFDMFKLALSSEYRNLAFVLDHDDLEREYQYPDDSTRADWREAAEEFGWHVVSMKNNFKQVFLKEVSQ